MISFVWPGFLPFVAGAGGSGICTLDHIAELTRRGIEARLVVYGVTPHNMQVPPGVNVLALQDPSRLAELDNTLVFVMFPVVGPDMQFKRQAFLALHTAVSGLDFDASALISGNGIGNLKPFVTSRFLAGHWQEVLGLETQPPVVYPGISDHFVKVRRPDYTGRTRVLFAGRPSVGKGLYVLLAALHMLPMRASEYELTCVRFPSEGNHDAAEINLLLDVHIGLHTTSLHRRRRSMAQLLAEHDVLVVPSIVPEAFGMLSAEGQKAGCRVVASDIGGLPETDCGGGGLILVRPESSFALAATLAHAIELGPLTQQEREAAAPKFSLADSVDSLLRVIGEA